MSNNLMISSANISSEIERCRSAKLTANFKFDGEPRLWLRVSHKGAAAWSLVYRPKGQTNVQRYGLGRYPNVPAKDAREMAREWMVQIAKGIDPRDVLRQDIEAKQAQQEKVKADAKADRLTVLESVERFIAAKQDKNRSTSHMKAMLEANLVRLHGDKAPADLTRGEVLALHDDIVARGAPRQADNVLATVRSLLSWAKTRHLITENVASRFERSQKHGEGIRERKLTAAEILALWLATENDAAKLSRSVRRVMKLAILLGQRASEIMGMRRGELTEDLMLWTIPAARMKV